MPGYGDAFIRAKYDEFEVIGRVVITRKRYDLILSFLYY